MYEKKKVTSNFATSIYGRKNFDKHLELFIKAGNLLYYNKQKSQDLFSAMQLQLPQALNNLDPNIILHQSHNISAPVAKNNEKNKSQGTPSVLGLQSSEGFDVLDSNNSIHQNDDNVKSFPIK